MKEYKISILGSQFSDPQMYRKVLEQEFNVTGKRIYLDSTIDSIIETEVMIGKNKYVFLSPVHTLWDYEKTYEALLEKCDGIIYLVALCESLRYLAEKDFWIFSNLCKEKVLRLPIVTLFNDIYCGKPQEQYAKRSDLLKYVLVHSPVFETQIAYFSDKQCNTGASDSLACLIKLMVSDN